MLDVPKGMKKTLTILGCLVLALAGAPWVRAQSQFVTTDRASVGVGPHPIDGMEFYDNGLIWWHQGGGRCSGELANQSSIGVMPVRTAAGRAYYPVLDCQTLPAGVTRDDAYYYFTGSGPAGPGLYRLAQKWPPDPPLTPIAPEAVGTRITTGTGCEEFGAAVLHSGRVYFAASSVGCARAVTIYSWRDTGGPGLSQPLVVVADGGGEGYMIKKMGFMRGVALSLPPTGICLDVQGHLFRFDSGAIRGPLVQIADNISDFAIRNETVQFGTRDVLYASTGVAPYYEGKPPGRLVSINPDTAAVTVIHVNSGNRQYTAIGLDRNHVFLSQYAVDCGTLGCSLASVGQIVSKYLPASLDAPAGDPNDANYDAIDQEGGAVNLRSDDQWLYFTRDKEIRRTPNNSPPIRLDIAALGLEAVQVIQDRNNSIRLVEGKRTIVRAYARLTENTTAQKEWFPGGELRGFRNGTPLDSGRPIYPLNRPHIINTDDYFVLRSNDLSYSFQFELPDSWVRSGRLTLRFTVNANLATYESGTTPLADNTYESAPISVVQVNPPCFVFTSIHGSGPNYWPWENAYDFASIMARAKAMLPVADIQIRPTTERISDEDIFSTDPFDLTTKDGWDEALEELHCFNSFDGSFQKLLRTYYVGAIHPQTPNAAWAGLGENPGRHFLSLMNPQDAVATFNSPYGGRTIAHEFGHNLGRPHVDQTMSGLNCGVTQPADADPNYPYDKCTMGFTYLDRPDAAVGFDMLSFSSRTTTPVIRPIEAADLMSYGTKRWPSPYTYNAMLDALGPVGPGFAPMALAAGPPPGPYFHISGVVDLARRHVRLSPCYTLPDGVAPAAKIQASLDAAALPPLHDYRVRIVNHAGAILQESPLGLEVAADLNQPSVTFVQYVPAPGGAAGLQIIAGGSVLAECHASSNAPSAGPLQVIPDAITQTLAVRYSASDADGDALHFTLQFSNDNGATWGVLRIHEGSLSYLASTRFLPGGPQCRVRLIATDGFHSAVAVSPPFALNRHAPEAFIGGVRDGQRLPFDTTASALGFALDAEDGSLPATTLSWVLQGPMPRMASGDALSLRGLSPGLYVATLSGRDSDNNSTAVTVHFEILPLVVADGQALIVDGAPNDPAYATATAVTWPFRGKSSARFLHADGYLYVAFTDLEYRGEDAQAAVVGLRIDPDASGGSSAQTSDIGFFVVDQGIAFQMRGDGATMQVTANPAAGFKAVVTRGQSGWNAEFRIAESLLGGWNHAVRVLLEHNYLTPDDPSLTVWPPTAGRDNPGTWAQVWLGNTPPTPAHLSPIATVEAGQTLNLSGPITVNLDGSQSYDPDGSPLTYAWTQLEGPSVTLQNAASATPSFAFSGAQTPVTLRFRLVVSNGTAASAPAETRIILQPATAQNVSRNSTATTHQDGSVTIQVVWPGANGDRVVVQASTDLSQWVNVATNTADFRRVILFHDVQAGLYRHRFYRLASAPTGPVCAGVPPGLVGWWQAEGDATDVTGVNHGTLLKGLGLAAGKVGQGLNFSGPEQGLIVPASSSLNVGQSEGLTVEAWINPADAVNAYPLADWSRDLANSTAFGLANSGALYGYIGNGEGRYVYISSPPGIIMPNVWQHVAFTYHKASRLGRLYHNGLEVAVRSFGVLHPDTDADFRIGQRLGYDSYRGLLDEVSLYNRALNVDEIQQVYQGGSAGKCAPVCGSTAAPLVQDFEPGNPATYTLNQLVSAPAASVQNANAGSSGRFLRLLTDGVNDNVNVITFDQTAPGPDQTVRAEFDFRLASADAPADGFAFMLIPTSVYGTTGPGFVAPIAFEEPNIAGVFAVGFDVHPRTEPRNDVSVHWDGTEYVNVTMPEASINLTAGTFHRALVTLRHISGGALVTVSLVPDINGTARTVYTPVRDLFVPGLDPFSARVELAGRTGALNMNVDLDNIVVHFLPFCLTGPIGPANSLPQVVYANDFEGAVGGEWSVPQAVSTTPVGARRFLGEFGSTVATLQLANLPAHTHLSVSFDLFILKSWDGNRTDFGPDRWTLSLRDGPTLVDTTFSQDPTGTQGYPGSFGASYPGRTGIAEHSTLGYTFGGELADSVYWLKATFQHTAADVTIDFRGLNLQDISDESWGLDNVRVEAIRLP